MAKHTFKLVKGCSHRIPHVHFNAFKPGRSYEYDDQNKNPLNLATIEALSIDSAFSHEIEYTEAEAIEQQKQQAVEDQHLAELRQRHQDELAVQAVEYAEKAAAKALADAAEAKERAAEALKRLGVDSKPEKKK